MGYWALKGCEGLAGRLCVGRGGEVRHTPKPVMRTLISCSEWCAVLETVVSGEPEELALLSPMAVVVFGVKCTGCAVEGCVGGEWHYFKSLSQRCEFRKINSKKKSCGLPCSVSCACL